MTAQAHSSGRATIEDRKALLERLRLPAGQATVERRSAQDGDELVVRILPGVRPAATPRIFRGHAVFYQPLRAARTF